MKYAQINTEGEGTLKDLEFMTLNVGLNLNY